MLEIRATVLKLRVSALKLGASVLLGSPGDPALVPLYGTLSVLIQRFPLLLLQLQKLPLPLFLSIDGTRPSGFEVWLVSKLVLVRDGLGLVGHVFEASVDVLHRPFIVPSFPWQIMVPSILRHPPCFHLFVQDVLQTHLFQREVSLDLPGNVFVHFGERFPGHLLLVALLLPLHLDLIHRHPFVHRPPVVDHFNHVSEIYFLHLNY